MIAIKMFFDADDEFLGRVHQENDTLSDLSDLSWHRHLRQNQTDLINLVKAMYLSKQDPNACHKAIKTLTDQPYTRH